MNTIADYALLSNCQGSALVGRDGAVDWACLPAFDSPPIFARIVGEAGGTWAMATTEPATTHREYVEGTMVLRTEMQTERGRVMLTDFMPLDPRDRQNDIGVHSEPSVYRVVEGMEGSVELDVAIEVRPEFGLTTPLVSEVAPGVWRTRGGHLAATINASRPMRAHHGVLSTRMTVLAGETVTFALRVGDPWGAAPVDDVDVLAALEVTISGWRSWAAKLSGYDGMYRAVVHRSALVLRALHYAPTGAIVAAPTTSLPEEIGGVRNWDYRYTWVRDASFTIGALAASGCGFEATKFFDFFATATRGSLASGQGLQIMYGIRGERFIPERVVEHLSGHRGSKPVRVGNGAWDQTQLDVYGELLDAAATIAALGIAFDDEFGAFLADVADRAALRWMDIDEGIWEVRGGADHFVYSKVMNWVALDRAIKLAGALGATPDRIAGWRDHRDRIRAAILEHGWSDALGAYAQRFGSDDLDASVLMMPIVGFLPMSDARMRATVEAVAERLTDEHGFVYRYLTDDGLRGGEGTFGICTFWLAECLAQAGEVDRARALFERMAGCANDVGLLSEEVDPSTRELLGNFPQAFTHIGLVHAALSIERAAEAEAETDA